MANTDLNIWLKVKDNASQHLGRVSGSVNTLTTNLIRLGGAYVGIRSFKALIDAANRQDDAIQRLNNALELQGNLSEEVSKKYQAFAKEMQRSTRYGDEAIEELMQQLISVGNVAPEMMERASKAAIDFAAATGRDLKTAALTVGKAMGGFTGELSRYGIILDDNLPKEQKALAALQAMERQFGGMAARDISTFAGATQQLGNAWGDVLEEIGKFITGSDDAIGTINKITSALSALAEEVDNLRKYRDEVGNFTFISPIAGLINLGNEMHKATAANNELVASMQKLADTGDIDLSRYDQFVDQMMITVTKHKGAAASVASEAGGEVDASVNKWIDTFHIWEELAKNTAVNIQNAFADSFFSAFKGELDSAQDFFASFGDALLRTAANIVAQMVTYFAIIAPLMAMFPGLAGVGGMFGTIGTVSKKQFGQSFVPETGPYILHRGEQVVPAGQSSGGPQTVNYFIQANDAASFQDMLRRNKASITSIVSENITRRGMLSNQIRTR